MLEEIFYFALVFLLGWLLLNLIGSKLSLEESVGLSPLLGLGFHSFFYYLAFLFIVKNPVNNLFVLVGEVSILIILSLFFRKKIPSTSNCNKVDKKKKLLNILLIIPSFFALGYTFLECVYWPVYQPDALSLYDFRAQRLLQGDLATFFNGTSFYQNNIYPPFTSLMHFFLYQIGETNPRIIYAVLFICFYLVIVGYVKRSTSSSTKGLLAGASVVLTPSIWWNSILALTNIPFMIFISTSVLYMFDFSGKKGLGLETTMLGAILLGLSTWTRIELFWLVPALVFFIWRLQKKQFLLIVVFLAIVLPLSYIWPLTLPREKYTYIPTPSKEVLVEFSAAKNVSINGITEKLRYFSNPLYQSWNLILPLFLLVVILEVILLKRRPNKIELVTLLLCAAIVIGMVNFSNRFKQWRELSSSVYRMSIIVIPLFWINIVSSSIWELLRFGDK